MIWATSAVWVQAQGQDPDPWAALAAARAEFETAPWTADFVQTYLPAGFSTGESETGRVSLALPGSLRWDYEVPYPKVFLVRVDTVYAWNDGESSGRRAQLGAADRHHLDLLRLDLAALQAAYGAIASRDDDGTVRVGLTPRDSDGGSGQPSQIQDAELAFGPGHHLTTLRYTDTEGNVTEFGLSGHRIVADNDLFAPPDGVEWLDE